MREDSILVDVEGGFLFPGGEIAEELPGLGAGPVGCPGEFSVAGDEGEAAEAGDVVEFDEGVGRGVVDVEGVALLDGVGDGLVEVEATGFEEVQGAVDVLVDLGGGWGGLVVRAA